jgi:phosphocarrier protein HPr
VLFTWLDEGDDLFMKTFTYKITDPEGLHARPAGLFVKCAAGYDSDISISLNGKTVDAKRLFAVMSLCIKQNDTITISVTVTDEDSACAALETFCREKL